MHAWYIGIGYYSIEKKGSYLRDIFGKAHLLRLYTYRHYVFPKPFQSLEFNLLFYYAGIVFSVVNTHIWKK